MAPKKKEIPLDDMCILGLKTLVERNCTHDAMAAYYTEKLKTHYSRRTVERWIEKFNLKEIKLL